ncbi:uncharacterized protein LOC119612686 [Lucilia sericata]|uniref:uncharacterized protein LOC119612686 n=1 Tax=Lucilia sericata TaxID=13632 RepID=UPI0018A833C6|nr:uncharacterized protein LOC119612686 [Lucilia sericata]
MSLDHFIRLADSIVEFEADYNENRYPINSLHALEIHRQEIKSTWAYEKFLFDKDNEDDTDPGESDDIEAFKDKYKSTYVTYCNILIKLSELTDALRDQSREKSDTSPINSQFFPVQPVSSQPSHSFHLPPCEIETFYGNYESWPTFRDLFTAMFIQNSTLSPVEKLFHLTQKTKGEAREIVKKSPLTNQGFDLAWANLTERFENRRVQVNGQLRILFNLPSITSESAKAIQHLQRDINSCISILRLHRIDVDSWDPIFVFLCSNKLPDSILTLWEQGLKDKTSIPKWSDLDLFLTNRYRTLESVSEIRSATSKPTESKPKKVNRPSKVVNAFQNNVSQPKCQLCTNEFHPIRKCPKFLQMGHSQRLSEIKKLSLCLNCFSKTHSVKNCNSKINCFRCHKRHNTLLHKETEVSTSLPGPSTSANSNLNPNSAPFVTSSNSITIQSAPTSDAEVVTSCFTVNSTGVLLGTAMIEIWYLDNRYPARALIDSGSEGSFISERLFNLLKLPSTRTNAQVSGLNNTISASVDKQCSFVISSILNPDIKLLVTALVVPQLSGSLPSKTFDRSLFSKHPPIQLADPHFHTSSKVDILIGGDVFPSIMRSGVKHNVCGSLMAQETIFGWILTGPLSNISSPSCSLVSYFCEISLDKEISRFWEVENLPRKNFTSSSDKFCDDLFTKTTRRAKDGRYIVSLPFKDGYPEKLSLGQSRNSAMAQFLRNEVRLLRSPDLKSIYDNVVEEYIDLDHMFKVSPPHNSKICPYYLPHHAVIKPESTTTKVRVVFNASSPSSNDILHTGPILQNDLTLLILKWRFFKYVFNADIQKMYRQILVDPKHTVFQRILFRNNPNVIIQDYELKTVTFGVNCAPYLAIRTLLQLDDDIEASYPKASLILRSSMYVDDELAGAHSIQEAKESKKQLILALQSAGFSLRKWTANSKEIIDDIPVNHLLCEDFLTFDDSSTAKTLGVRWNARSDSFFFVAKPFPDQRQLTKREVLSQIARLFDPAGITQITDPKLWNHVNSESNPADLASRGVYPKELVNNHLWWFGPDWLRESRANWPMSDKANIPDTEIEKKNVKVHFSYFQHYEDILERFSSFPRALRVVSYIFRFLFRTHPRLRSNFHKSSLALSSSEIIFARDRLITNCQKVGYPAEYRALSSRQVISSSSSILNLNPFLDSEGLIRSCGRLENSPGLSYNEKHPVIIPYNCQYSRLLVKFVHDISLHGGNQLVLRLIRTHYWIPKVKNLIKTTI